MSKLALVGGSSAGIGRAIAEGLLDRGLDVVLTARGGERLRSTASELKQKFKARSVHAFESDSSSAPSVEALIAAVKAGPGEPDVLVLNTGGPKPGTFDDIEAADWDQAYQQQFKSSIALLKAFLPSMRRKKWGRVINVSSTVAIEPTPGMVLSAGYRAMLINALKCLAHLVGKDGVTVNTVCPGAVRTDRLLSLFRDQARAARRSEQELLEEAARKNPLQRIAAPAEFAHSAVFLASEEASFITGVVLPVDGGMTGKSF
jgi:3-oxoacyl-[acyl-carrier protein] reductase